MKIRTIIILPAMAAALFFNAADAMAWGQKGHDIVCSIAQKHLSPKAKRHIVQVLDGKSIVYWANWLDNASHTPEFSYTKTWHYLDIDPGETLGNMERESKGDVLTGIHAQIEAIGSGKLSKEDEETALKILIHLVGDMHCPMHVGHKDDLGGNRHQVQFFDRGTNLHKVWDESILESAHKWSCNEWVEQLDIYDRKTCRAIAGGSIEDWLVETSEIASKIYEKTPRGAKLSYDYTNAWAPVVEQQLLRAGLRLSVLLNGIYR